MKKLKRVFGSVANLSSGRDDQSSADPPLPLSTSRKSISGSVHGLGDHRGSYVSYESQSLDSFNSIASADIDPYSKHDKNFTKLHKWAYIGDVTKLKKFIKKIPVDLQDGEGKTALHHAAAQGRGDTLLFLLGSKGNVELKDNNGMTPFLRAVERSQLPVVQMLVQRKVDINVTDNQGNSSCHLAARTGAVDLLTLLLDCGCDCDAVNSLGRTPLHLACSENQQEIVETLLRHGSSVNVVDKEGVTPLMMAAKVGSAPLVETLLEHGADVSNFDASKWSAADYARFTNHNQLHHRLSSLMEKGKSSGLFSSDLLNVSDEGNSVEEEGSPVLKKKEKASDDDGPADSWSDTSEVNSIKEKPKINLLKFLPSSDDSADNAVGNVSDSATSAVGPPKPPRLYASSSSIASAGMDEKGGEKTPKNTVGEDEEDPRTDDSWKSSSDEEPLVKPLSLFPKGTNVIAEMKERESSLDMIANAAPPSRIEKEDLVAELGLDEMEFHSSEEVSFDDEYPVLPIEDSAKPARDSRRSSSAFIGASGGKDSLPIDSCSQEGLQVTPQHSSRSSVQSSAARKVTGTGESHLSTSEEDVKKMPHSSRKLSPRKSPKKMKPIRRKSSIDDSDTEEEELPRSRLGRKTSTPIRKKAESLVLAGDIHSEENDEEDAAPVKLATPRDSPLKSPSKGDMLSIGKVDGNGKSKMKVDNMPSNLSDVSGSKLSVFPESHVRSGSSTLSTVVGTLGREGTMQEMEEMWEANPSVSPKHSCSESSAENSEDQSKSLGKESHPVSDGLTELGLSAGAGNLDTIIKNDEERVTGNENFSDSEDNYRGQDVNDAVIREADSINAVGSNSSRSSTSPGSQKSPTDIDNKFIRKSSVSKEELLIEDVKHKVVPKEKVESRKEKEEKRISSGKSNSDKIKTHSVTSTSPSRRGSRTGTGRTSGFGSIVFSDEDSISQDLLTTPGFMEDIDDVISAASTETEESTHINSGLKDSLLTPLSSLPDAADVNQLQDLVRELRLKLEKEFGRRAALETRYSKLRQQEKQTRSQNNHLEQDIQRMEQEVSSLTARIKQLEYLGQCEQDSSRLKDQSLEEFHLRCEELEEQCGTLCTNALHQEQLVESLMVQLQTKERVNQSLQSRLEDISSQTKYVSMKSCQTEEILADAPDSNKLISSVEVSVQTVDDDSSKVSTDLKAEENDSEIVDEKLCSECMKQRDQIALETTDISLQTEIEIQSKADKPTLVCIETQTLQSCKEVSSTGVQCVPEKVMKTSQTCNTAQSHQSQTEMTNDNSEVILKKSFNESTCQTSFLGKVALVQTENIDFPPEVQQVHSTGGQNLSAAEVASTLEPVLQNFFQDFKSLMFEAMEGNQSSLQETMNKSVANQINDLKSNMEKLLQQKAVDQTHETELKFKELSHDVNEILQRQVDTVTEFCDKTTSDDKSNVQEVLMQTNNSLESKFQDLKQLVEDIKQNQGSGEEKITVHLENILKDAENSSQKIMKTLVDFKGENLSVNNEVYEKIDKLMGSLANVQKSIQDLIHSEDKSFSEDNMKDIINRLNLVEKSLLQSIEKNHVSQDISSLESELCKINDGIHKKLSTLQLSMQAVASSGGVDEEVLDLCLEKLRENNKQLLNVFRAKASESTTNISEVIEENFHIIQEHLRKVQQSLAQRLNELSQDFSHTEDKMSCTSKQINDMASQVTGVQNNLLHIQSSLEALQSMPSAGGFIDEALLTSLRAGNEQVASSLSFQYQSIIRLLESLQKEVHNTTLKAHGSEDKTELRLLKEKMCEKEAEISSLCDSQESLQKKLREKISNLEHSQRKEEELHQKCEGLLKKWHQSENTLREIEEELKREKLKAASQNDNLMKLQQENFQLSTENSKLSSRLSSEQHQKNLYESEWQSHRDAREAAETRVQDLMVQLNQQRLQVQRTPPSGRDKDDDIILAKQKEIQELEIEKRKIETLYNEQCTKLQHIELQLKETEAQLILEQSNRDDLEKQLKKTKNSVERLQKSLSEASVEHEALQDLEDRNKELEETLKSNEMAMDTLRKKLESIVKEKLNLKQDIMFLREEKLSFEMIKQEKDLAEEMQRKMETQLQLLQQKISDDYVPKMRLNHLKKELEQKYQLELSTKISELNHFLKEQSQLQESHVKAKESEEQGLKGEISRLSEETVRLRALLSIHEEEKDSWKVRHDRLMNLYQQQAQPQHYLPKSSYPKKRDDSLSINLREINAHLQSPLASSTLLGRLTPPKSLNPPKSPGNIDSYHYTHADSMDRMLQKCLKAAENDHSRYLSTSDDKPHARISPMQTSQSLQDSLPSMDKSCKAYVDLLNKKYCL
ncbi:ankyrin repeat domain-containing protein 30A-like [Palaemon carinicauda]|uniref:ankyrin repeat domain-containing protein 30A-like n=1 Tax=Palaemon carinicauda TaxID=392227 RepID=UPI0035B6191E